MIKQICGVILICFSIACSSNQQKEPVAKLAQVDSVKKDVSMVGQPVVAPAKILVNFLGFYNYYVDHVKLYEDFKAFNEKHEAIDNETFLKQLATGTYFPMALYADNDVANYELQRIPQKADKTIADYLRQTIREQLVFYKMEGKKIPAFNFSDVNGKLYTSENTKGKIVLFKCWFIRCGACVKEMPALNKLVAQYKDNPDVLFISLASDAKANLKGFLSKTKFDYATVANQDDYMTKKLNVSAYPTHFLINKEGVLVRVLPNDVAVRKALGREVERL